MSAVPTHHDVTAILAKKAGQCRFEDIPQESLEVARQCILDWFGVTLGAINEPLVEILRAQAQEEGGNEQATIFGQQKKGTTHQAALVNGAAGHALDYDDVNMAMHGHPTVPVFPAVLALAEQNGASGQELMTAFVAGYETECHIGDLVGVGHYEKGFHATATLDTFGAAAGCAKLMRLNAEETARAFGIAGTQAAGLKSMFGTMCKPLHAGKAAANGLLAVKLAARGFSSCEQILDTNQGFAHALSDACHREAALVDPAGGFHLRNNLFKYHAACYQTHASMEALRALKQEHQLTVNDIASITIITDPGVLTVCNIENPKTGLAIKFSLRHTAALTLMEEDTGAISTYSDANAVREDLVALRDKVRVDPQGDQRRACTVRVALTNGSQLTESYDAGIPATDVVAQGERVKAKFRSLASPVLGTEKSAALLEAVYDLENIKNVNELTVLDL